MAEAGCEDEDATGGSGVGMRETTGVDRLDGSANPKRGGVMEDARGKLYTKRDRGGYERGAGLSITRHGSTG